MSVEEELESRAEIARRVFEYWKEVTKHPRSQLDDKRFRMICDRLKNGYSEADLRAAVWGCSVSRWHQGDNDRRQVYDSVELIFRNADKVDQFIRIAEQEQEKRARQKILSEQDREGRLAASVRGEGYEKHRAQILSLLNRKKSVA